MGMAVCSGTSATGGFSSGGVTGVICGIRVEEIEDPLTKRMRQLDKLIDELATGKPMEKVLR